jgi:hypothetical protein
LKLLLLKSVFIDFPEGKRFITYPSHRQAERIIVYFIPHGEPIFRLDFTLKKLKPFKDTSKLQ